MQGLLSLLRSLLVILASMRSLKDSRESVTWSPPIIMHLWLLYRITCLLLAPPPFERAQDVMHILLPGMPQQQGCLAETARIYREQAGEGEHIVFVCRLEIGKETEASIENMLDMWVK